MPYKDMREFMEFLRKRDELKVCRKEVDTKIEIAKVTDKSSKTDGPAILFNNVKGFNTSVVTGLYGTVDRSFLAIDSDKYNGFKKLAGALENPLKPRIVSDGPCKEVIKQAKDVDLHEIPALWHHKKDSHYFITATVCRIKDPDTGICNSSIHRMAVQSKDKITLQANLPHEIGRIIIKYLKMGKAAPIAIAIGVDPGIFICSGVSIPDNVDEFDFAGGIRGEPVEVIKCETMDLEVPAMSELVIEGEIVPGDEEGYVGKTEYGVDAPFGEMTGYYGRPTRSPVLQVKAITHRKDYIYHALGTADPPSEHQVLNAIGVQGGIFTTLKSAIPAENITAINPLMGSCGTATVLSIKKRYPGQAKQLIYTLLTKIGIKKVIIVDDDIDVFNHIDVEWAVSFRASTEDYIITSEIPAINLDPMITTPPNLLSKIGIDATLPVQGDKKGRLEVLCDLGPARYTDLDKVNLEAYLGD